MQPLQKERLTLEDAATKLLSLGLKAGAEAAEVCAVYRVKTKISLEKQDFHMASSDDGFQLGIRVISQRKQGFSSVNSTESKDLKDAASRAVEIAGFSPANPNYVIVGSSNISREAPTELWDDALFNLSLQTQKDWTKLLADESMRDPRFRLNDGSVAISAGIFLLVNSQGTHKIERETVVNWGAMGMGVEGTSITSFDHFQKIQRSATGTPDRIVNTTREFRERVLAGLKQGSPRSYRGLVIFSPRAVIDIFLGGILHHLNGRSLVEGTSRWPISKMGEVVLNPKFSLRDNPWLVDRTGFSAFDREGIPTAPSTLIDFGVVRNFLLDTYAATALKKSSTGHASGGPTATPVISPHCLCVAGGDEKLSALVHRGTQQQNECLVVHRFSGRTDPITGDFSGVAKGGEWLRGGERAYFVQETLVSGNIFEALGANLFGISQETEINDCSDEAPTILADNISVTGG